MLCIFAAGAFEGTAETVQFHYDEFDKRFPRADEFWDASKSWQNKYKNGDPLQGPKFPLSTTALVWTTDGYHLMRTMRNVSFLAAILITPNCGLKWHHYILKAAMYSLAYTAGFHLTYTLIFKR